MWVLFFFLADRVARLLQDVLKGTPRPYSQISKTAEPDQDKGGFLSKSRLPPKVQGQRGAAPAGGRETAGSTWLDPRQDLGNLGRTGSGCAILYPPYLVISYPRAEKCDIDAKKPPGGARLFGGFMLKMKIVLFLSRDA